MFIDINAVVFDLDGTINAGKDAIPGAREAVEFVRDRGLRVFFCTNNSSEARGQIVKKLGNMGISCNQEDVYSSGWCTVEYLRSANASNVWVVGSDFFKSEVSKVSSLAKKPEEAETLVVGFDINFNHSCIADAVHAAINSEKIVFCNEEVVYVGEGGKIFPGCGAITAAIRACSEKEPDVVIGKPYPFMMEMITRSSGISAKNILVVGDSINSDLMFARNSGASSVLISDKKYEDTLTIKSIKHLPKLFDADNPKIL